VATALLGRGYLTAPARPCAPPALRAGEPDPQPGIADLGRAVAVDVHLTGDHLRVLNEMPAQVRSRY
jgi:hypothetical protein